LGILLPNLGTIKVSIGYSACAQESQSGGYFAGRGISPAFAIAGAASGEARKRSSAVGSLGLLGRGRQRTRERKPRLHLGRKRA
jgi:hypothetical protein